MRLEAVVILVLFSVPLLAQPAKVESAKTAQDPKVVAAARKAIASWVGVHIDDRDALVSKSIDRIDAAGKKGIAMLASELRAAGKDGDQKREAALHSLVGHLGLRWFVKVEKSKLVFAGQYDDLGALMPAIGDFYLGLLVQTPEWFPINERIKVIPALRDLYPKGPDRVIRDQVEAMATDDKEPKHLRTGLAYALAQWGNRKLIRTEIRSLGKKSRSDDDETSILALRDLAEIYYKIRDYQIAAVTYRDFIRKSEAVDYYLVPVHYYNAACSMCLSGDRRSALDFVRRCLKLNKSSKIDSSMRMVRKQFENDPEIALVRKTSGFAEMLDKAFGKKDGAEKKKMP